MVKAIIEHNGQVLEGENPDGILLLTDRHGGFFSCCPGENLTKYNGLVRPEGGALLKTIDALGFGLRVRTVRMTLDCVERESDIRERFALTPDALYYHATGAGDLSIDLDVRRTDDFGAQGRLYETFVLGDLLLVRYRRLDGDRLLYETWLAIAGATPEQVRVLGEWQPRTGSFDQRRSDAPRRWVYRCASVRVEGELTLTITHAATKEEALALAERARGDAQRALSTTERAQLYRSGDVHADLALASLDALTTKLPDKNFTAIWAGLPWFTQFWSRDELVCAGALIASDRLDARNVLDRYLALGAAQLPAHYPSGGLAAGADAFGWLATRTHQFFLALEREHMPIARRDLERVLAAFGAQLEKLPAELVRTGVKETWMDTDWGGDTREGACIEIQAMTLRAMHLCAYAQDALGIPATWRERERALAALVKAQFFRGSVLRDHIGPGPGIVHRPNIFLAHYAYPWLLSEDEWRSAFDAALPRLALLWGGLSSVDVTHPLFCAFATGMDNRSYHRGDSWYWVNAAAALALARVDEERYREQIAALKAALCKDLVACGAVGHCSEISAAALQQWNGCFAQAWSAAFLLELLLEKSHVVRYGC